MKNSYKLFVSILLAIALSAALFGCQLPVAPSSSGSTGAHSSTGTGDSSTEAIDYASQLTLDFSTNTKKQEVEVRIFVDGDTTHFDPVEDSELTGYNADDFKDTFGYIKARYLAVDTPESTGDIEKWGKSASIFTRSKLEKAEKIVVESDDDKWNIDSTGYRYTLWIWYIPEGGDTFRNLNIEILQEGFGRASSTSFTRYGDIAFKALSQAQELGLHVYSPASTKDPNYFEDPAVQLDIKTLRFHINNYQDKAVRVEGVVTARFGNTAYIEDYDAETQTNYGIAVFYAYDMGEILNILSVGNRVSVHGKVNYYETGDTWQISDVEYDPYWPEDETNTILLGKAEPPFTETTVEYITKGTTLNAQFEEKNEDGEEILVDRTLDSREAIMASSVTVKNLTVKSIYTTAEGQSAGAMSITCEDENGNRITVRTEVLKENNTVITQDRYIGKTITVKGIVDKFQGSYQIHVHLPEYITII